MIFRGNINGINCQFGGLFMTKRAFYGKTVSFLAVWLTGRDDFKGRVRCVFSLGCSYG